VDAAAKCVLQAQDESRTSATDTEEGEKEMEWGTQQSVRGPCAPLLSSPRHAKIHGAAGETMRAPSPLSTMFDRDLTILHLNISQRPMLLLKFLTCSIYYARTV
jgi:hypothetical protein